MLCCHFLRLCDYHLNDVAVVFVEVLELALPRTSKGINGERQVQEAIRNRRSGNAFKPIEILQTQLAPEIRKSE